MNTFLLILSILALFVSAVQNDWYAAGFILVWISVFLLKDEV